MTLAFFAYWVKVQRVIAFSTAAVILVYISQAGAVTVILKAFFLAIFAVPNMAVSFLNQDLTFLAFALSSCGVVHLLLVLTFDIAIAVAQTQIFVPTLA